MLKTGLISQPALPFWCGQGYQCGSWRHYRWLGDQRAKIRRRSGQRQRKVRRQQVEVGRVNRAVVVEISLTPAGSGVAEIAREQVEIDRVNRSVEIRVAGIRVADKYGTGIDALAGEGGGEAREHIRRLRDADGRLVRARSCCGGK